MAQISFFLPSHKDRDTILGQARRPTASGDRVAIHLGGRASGVEHARLRASLAGDPRIAFAASRVRPQWAEWHLVRATPGAAQAPLALSPPATTSISSPAPSWAFRRRRLRPHGAPPRPPNRSPIEGTLMSYAAPAYDDGNVFARILRGEIPNRTVLDTPHALAFHDLHPQAPVHVLVLPKGAYTDLADFAARAPADEQAGFLSAVAEVCRLLGVEGGFRAIANAGPDSSQEVPHFHLHILGGRPLGPLLARLGG